MKLVKLFMVPEDTQVVLQDLGLIGTRKTARDLDSSAMVDIEVEGTGGKKRTVKALGSQDVFVDEFVQLLIT